MIGKPPRGNIWGTWHGEIYGKPGKKGIFGEPGEGEYPGNLERGKYLGNLARGNIWETWRGGSTGTRLYPPPPQSLGRPFLLQLFWQWREQNGVCCAIQDRRGHTRHFVWLHSCAVTKVHFNCISAKKIFAISAIKVFTFSPTTLAQPISPSNLFQSQRRECLNPSPGRPRLPQWKTPL